MRATVRGAIVGAATLVALMALGTAAHAGPDTDFKCRQTINKEYTKYVKTLTKINQKCNEAVVKLATARALPAATAATSRLAIRTARFRPRCRR